MAFRIKVICPKESGKRYFDKKTFRYSNSMNIFFNDLPLFENINDVEENLPINLEKDIDINFEVDNFLKIEYNIRIGDIVEYADVVHRINKEKVVTNIIRKNHVEKSNTLTYDYKITFDINGSQTYFGKDYHEGSTKDITFSNKFGLPLDIQWYSKKQFTFMQGVFWDHIHIRIENGNQ